MQEEKCGHPRTADTEWLAAPDSSIGGILKDAPSPKPMERSASAPPDIGTVLDGRYRLVKKLGCGGTSSVFLAEHLSVGNLWAVKIIPSSEDPADTSLKESEILKRLSHPMLPRITDVMTHEGNLCIIMDYVRGRNLADRLREDGPIPEPEVRTWLLQLCDVLSYLHNQMPDAVIYRDLKPANLIADEHGHLKLVDFGTARRYRKNEHLDTAYIGTQGYAAPEQYGFRQSDARTDIYNLGMTLFHLLTGTHPVSVPHGDLEKVLQNSQVSPQMSKAICRCVQLSPSNRYQDALSLRKEMLGSYPGSTMDGKADAPEPFTGPSSDSECRMERVQGGSASVYAKRPFHNGLSPLGARKMSPVPAQARIAVVGACPGAGATFACVAMASYLSEQTRNTAIAELNTSGDFLRFRRQLERIGRQTVPLPGPGAGEAFRFGRISYHPACHRLTDLRGSRVDVVLMDLGSVRTEIVIDEFLRADWQFVYCPQADWKFGHVMDFIEAVDDLDGANRFHYLLPYQEKQGFGAVQAIFGKRSVVAFPRISNPFDPSPGECRQLERMFHMVGLEG